MREIYVRQNSVDSGFLRCDSGNLDGLPPPLKISPYAYETAVKQDQRYSQLTILKMTQWIYFKPSAPIDQRRRRQVILLCISRQFQKKHVKNLDNAEEVWFRSTPMGKNMLGNIVKKFCDAAGIAGKKTNHSLRKTCVTALSDAGVPPHKIIKITGHRSTSSLQHYDRDLRNEEHVTLSNILQNQPEKTPQTTCTNQETTQQNALMSAPLSSESGPTFNGTYQNCTFSFVINQKWNDLSFLFDFSKYLFIVWRNFMNKLINSILKEVFFFHLFFCCLCTLWYICIITITIERSKHRKSKRPFNNKRWLCYKKIATLYFWNNDKLMKMPRRIWKTRKRSRSN